MIAALILPLFHLLLTLLLLRSLVTPAEVYFRSDLRLLAATTDWLVRPIERLSPLRAGIATRLLLPLVAAGELGLLLLLGVRPPGLWFPLLNFLYGLFTACVFLSLFVPAWSQGLVGRLLHRIADLPRSVVGGNRLGGLGGGIAALLLLAGAYVASAAGLLLQAGLAEPLGPAAILWIGRLSSLVGGYALVVLVRVLIGWFSPDAGNPLTSLLYRVTDPYLDLFRRIIPPIGMIDLSPIPALLLLSFARTGLARLTAILSGGAAPWL
jgi:YggT family protein